MQQHLLVTASNLSKYSHHDSAQSDAAVIAPAMFGLFVHRQRQ